MSSTASLSFGDLLRHHRRAAGLTQEELAAQAGLSVRGINDLERGARRTPRRDTVTLLAGALHLVGAERAAFEAAARGHPEPDSPGMLSPPPFPASYASSAPAAAGDQREPAGRATLFANAPVQTFLIADVRGYIRFTADHGDEAAARLAAQFAALLRTVAEAHGGRLLDLRGDEALVVFASSRQALQAAVGLQARIARAEGGEPTLPLPVGIGLDAGEAVPVEKGYRGGALNLAARLCSLAGPGEVLASESVTHLARKVPGLVYRDRGLVQLKGLPDPVRVYRVLSADAAGDEASGERVDVQPPLHIDHNLPIQLTSFIGRQREMAEIEALLDSAHLVTLTGAGGSGKTRLAVEVAAAMRERFPNGVWVIELGALTDPRRVADTIARTLDVRQEPSVPTLRALVDYLWPRRLLMVLDNCEHLMLACAQLVEALLGACPQLRILATSREALRIPGEAVWLVPPLPRPEPHPLLLLQDLMRYEAVALFIERARAALPTFMISGQDVQAVAELCARLDGLPLAIEMAAARVKMLSVGEIAERLDGSFRLLSGGSRTALPRQQTLKATLDWSHNLLSPEEQALFRGLAVFAGGFTLRAAEQVVWGAHQDASHALDLLTGLAEKSLAVPGGDRAGGTRCRLLEPIRQYAWQYLEASGEAVAVQGRHAQFFLACAEAAVKHLEAPDQAVWLDRLEQDHDNLRAALRWFVRQRAIARGLQLACSLWMFWFVRGYVPEGRERFAELLALAGEDVPAAARANALNNAGVLARYASDYAAARALIGESLRIRRELGDTQGTADSLANLGFVTLHLGDYAAARSAYQESLAINRTVGNRQGVADTLSHLALAAVYEHDLASARTLDEESLAIWRELGDDQGVAWALHQLGNVVLQQGDDEAAHAIFTESLRVARGLGLRWGIAWSLEDFARLAARHGSPERALRLAGCAAVLRRQIGIPLLPREHAEFEATWAASRQTLGLTASAVAWSEGEAMPVEQAMDEVLG